MKFNIWSVKHSMWYGPGQVGYVDTLAGAGVYTGTEASEILALVNYDPGKPSVTMVPVFSPGHEPADPARAELALREIEKELAGLDNETHTQTERNIKLWLVYAAGRN